MFFIIIVILAELSSESLRTCFKIINGYIFLSSTEFLQVCCSFCIVRIYIVIISLFPQYLNRLWVPNSILCLFWYCRYIHKYNLTFHSISDLCSRSMSVLLWTAKGNYYRWSSSSAEGNDYCCKFSIVFCEIGPSFGFGWLTRRGKVILDRIFSFSSITLV